LQAWAILSNHYHFVANVGNPNHLSEMLHRFHSHIGAVINDEDKAPGRKVMFEYWDTHITSSKSYYVRLRYVHENPARHKLVEEAVQYPWCSAAWFLAHASGELRNTVASFKIDRVNVPRRI
jgi:putative transposase